MIIGDSGPGKSDNICYMMNEELIKRFMEKKYDDGLFRR
jgi:hypothetical protein